MPDYSLGRAHGKIEITYDGGGARAAAKDLDGVTASSTAADKSLEKTQKTLKDTDRQFDTTGDAAQGYSARLKEVRQASDDVDNAQRNLNATLLDARASLDDVKDAEDRLAAARERHARVTHVAQEAHRAYSSELSTTMRVVAGLSNLMPKLSGGLDGWASKAGEAGKASDSAAEKAGGLAKMLDVVAVAAVAVGHPEVAAGIKGASFAIDGITAAAQGAADAVKQLLGFELEFAKISGAVLGGGSIAGLAGLGGASGVQGIINVAGAARQLSGVLGLLPAVAAGVGFSMGTLEVAFHGVGDALTDMMADDPKKFLEDIKNMGPAAAQAMLGIAQFRDEFKLAGAAVQDSFFTKIAADIEPLIKTWLPLIAGGMSQISGIFGEAAHELAMLFETPEAVQAFSAFIENISAGLQAMQPAIKPLFGIFQQLTVIGSSFFEQIGGKIADTLTVLVGLLGQATQNGSFQAWIQSAINGFGYLVDMVINVGQAFGNIMTIADKFGGGGLLGWLDQLAGALNNWTQSTEGQKALTDFFTTVREATDAFLPMLGPLVSGLSSIATAFVQLGVAVAPGWQAFFDMFAQAMANLAPHIVSLGPALNQFLSNLGVLMVNIVNQVGPRLPELFNIMSNAFGTLQQQLYPLLDAFMDLAMRVGPQLPGLFAAVTAAIVALTPYIPILVDLFRNFVSVLTLGIEAFAGVVTGIADFVKGILDMPGKVSGAINRVVDVIGDLFNLSDDAKGWGQRIIRGLIEGLMDAGGLGALAGAAKSVVEGIAGWFQSSPAKWGPFSGDGYTKVRGQQMVTDMAEGMQAAQGTIATAARATAVTASSALGVGGGAPAGGAEGLGGALLPPHIAGADNSVLSAYLRHQFSDTRGLKGLAKDMGNILQAAQSGFDLLSQNIAGTMFQALGMVPGANTRPWVKMSPEQIAAQQQNELQRKALAGQEQGPSWSDVFGVGAPGTGTPTNGANTPLGVTASSSKAEIQKAIIAAGRARGMNDAAIQTALAVAAAESGFNPTISGGIQGSAGLVSGLYQQSPSSGWGTLDQVNDPNYAINAFYDAFAKQLEKNPTDPMLAAVLTQNPQLGSGARGSDYWDAVSAQLLLGGQILAQQGKDVKGPTWQQVTGSGTADYANWYPAAAPPGASGYTSDEALLANVPAGRYTQSQDVDLTKGLADCSSAVEDLVNLIDGRPTGGRSMSTHNADEWLTARGFLPGVGGPGDFRVGFNSGHMQATLPGGTPFNWGSDDSAARRGIGGTGADDPAFTSHYYRPTITAGVGGSAGTGNSLVLPSGKPLDELLDATSKNLSVNDQLLQAYLQGNPALAAQIDAAKTPGAPDQSVLAALTGIDSTITDLKTQDATGNKNTIDALQSTQSQIARDAGFQQGQSALSTVQSMVSGISGAVGAVAQVVTSTLDAMAATQDIADRLVYGVRNTEDVMKLVDNVQKYIPLAANIANATGSIISAVGAIGGASGGMDMGASSAVSAAGQVAQLIGAALQSVNMAIDFAQDVYHIAGTYVGRFLSQLTAGLGGTPLMGDVRFLLNKNTGQLITYSEDNPGNKNSLNVPSWINQTYDYGGGQNPNPTVNTQWNIYAGPGQSPGEMLNETMWMVNTQGTTGALAAANF